MKLSTGLVTYYAVFKNTVQVVNAIGSVITDGIENNKDRTPVLGRGYSPQTGDLMSSCLEVPGVTQPSYDYTYDFRSFLYSTSKSDSATATNSFASEWSSRPRSIWSSSIDDAVASEIASTPNEITFFYSEMAADLYYASVDDSVATISEDAIVLLTRGEYIGFIQACGPYYIRTVRRQKAIVTLFQYELDTNVDDNLADSANVSLSDVVHDLISRVDGVADTGNDRNRLVQNTHSSSLTIQIFGFGLTMDSDVLGSLVANSIEQYDDAMNYGFEAMKSIDSGLVKSIEVYPWVANMSFQQSAKIDVKIEQETCYELVSRTITSGTMCVKVDPSGVGLPPTENRVNCNTFCDIPCDDGQSCENRSDCGTGGEDPFFYVQISNANEAARLPSEYAQFFGVQETIVERRSTATCVFDTGPFICYAYDTVLVTAGRLCTSDGTIANLENCDDESQYFTISSETYFADTTEKYNKVDTTHDTFAEVPTEKIVTCPTDINPLLVEDTSTVVTSIGNKFVLSRIEVLSRRELVSFPETLKQFNFMANAEFIATADAIVRHMFNSIELLSQCVGFLSALPEEILARSWVRNQRRPLQDEKYRNLSSSMLSTDSTSSISSTDTLSILSEDFSEPLLAKRLLTVLKGENINAVVGQRHLYERQLRSFLSFVTNFYGPCLEDLSSDDLQFSGGKLYTKHWVTLPKCKKPVCLIRGSVWSEHTSNCELGEQDTNDGYDPAANGANNDPSWIVDSYCMPDFYQKDMENL